MDQAFARAACDDLQLSWFNRDFERCCAIIADAAPDWAAPQSAIVGALARALIPLRVEPLRTATPANDSLETFHALRADLIGRAAATDPSVSLALKSQSVVTRQSEAEWTLDMLNQVALRARLIGDSRDGLWENAALVHWSIGRLLAACRLDQNALASLLMALLQTDSHLSWEAEGASVHTAMIHDHRKTLQDGFVEQVLALAQAGLLSEPEAFVQFDTDGRLLPALIAAVLKIGIRHPNSAALLYFLVNRGEMPAADFVARVADRPYFVVTDRTCLIMAGDFLPLGVCRTLRQVEGVDRSLRLMWWLNVNFPREQLADAAFIAARIPIFVRALLAHDKATLVLCATGEASWFSPPWVGWMRGIAERLGCRPEQVVYLPQNANFAADYRTASPPGMAKPAFGVATFNTHLLLDGLRADPAPNARPTKRFVCFNQRSHLHRVALLLSLHRDGLLEQMHLSFNRPIRAESPLGGRALEPWLRMPAAAIDSLIAAVEPSLPLRLDLQGQGVLATSDGDYVGGFNATLFADAAVYLVTETEMEGRAMCRFTEKTVKGLAAEIPFIVFGSLGVLASLRELGFRTFSPIIDDSYDSIEDPVARFQRAYAEVLRLNAMPMSTLIGLRQVLHPVLDHNRRHLLAIAPILHDRLAAALEPPVEDARVSMLSGSSPPANQAAASRA